MSDPTEHVFIFDMARQRSHLFFRWLGTYPDYQSYWHPFLDAFLFGPERVTLKTRNSREEEWTPVTGERTYVDAVQAYRVAYEAAKREGKVLVANEHCQMVLKQELALAIVRDQEISSFSNPTQIPDQWIPEVIPIFVVRNPVFSLPSVYVSMAKTSKLRPGDEDWELLTDLRSVVYLFEYFRARSSRAPIVVDGDDVVWRTHELKHRLCEVLAIDPDGISSTWNATSPEKIHQHPLIQYFLKDINASTGIQRPSTSQPDPDLNANYAKWIEEHGRDIANDLHKTAEKNIPHYQYLRQFKI